MEIRPITPTDDRMAISGVYEESWKFAYRGIVPQDYLDSIPRGRWLPVFDVPGRHTLICMDNGRIVGTVGFGPSRIDRLDGWGEIISIYLLPDSMGKGYGTALMNAALSECRRLGYDNIFLWVLEENTRARAFYERLGFLPTDDCLTDTIGGKELREVRYIHRRQ